MNQKCLDRGFKLFTCSLRQSFSAIFGAFLGTLFVNQPCEIFSTKIHVQWLFIVLHRFIYVLCSDPAKNPCNFSMRRAFAQKFGFQHLFMLLKLDKKISTMWVRTRPWAGPDLSSAAPKKQHIIFEFFPERYIYADFETTPQPYTLHPKFVAPLSTANSGGQN